MSAMEVACPKCGAEPGSMCVTPQGRTARAIHSARTNPWLQSENVESKPLNIPRPVKVPKHRWKVRNRHYVWCDTHGVMHGATTDPYDYGAPDCDPKDWRRVYVGSDDPQEKF